MDSEIGSPPNSEELYYFEKHLVALSRVLNYIVYLYYEFTLGMNSAEVT